MKLRLSEEVKFGAFVLVPGAFFTSSWLRSNYPVLRFRFDWTQNFRNCQTFADVEKLQIPKGTRILSRQFADGSWVAMAWHNAHVKPMGLTWEASLFRDSTGKSVWASNKHFCDEKRLDAEFYDPKIRNLQQFWKRGPVGQRVDG